MEKDDSEYNAVSLNFQCKDYYMFIPNSNVETSIIHIKNICHIEAFYKDLGERWIKIKIDI